MMSSFTIDEVPIPPTLDAPDASDFIACTEVRNLVEADTYGMTDLCYSPAEMLAVYLDAEHRPRRLLAGRIDGKIVARAVFSHLAAEREVAWADIQVLPAYRRRGIGSALADRVEAFAQGRGSQRLVVYAPSAPASGRRIAAPTGVGSLPARNAEVQFLLHRGYSLEQVERCSRLSLPADQVRLEALASAAAAAAGTDYRVHLWQGPTPEGWRAQVAHLHTVMSIEEPSAGLDEPPDVWTPERLVEAEVREEVSGRIQLVAAVEHLPTHQLAGFTVMGVPSEVDRPVSQEDTLVVPGHRGRRLGMLLKVANIAFLSKNMPGHPAIYTFNAEENRHMLDVNEAVGFVAIGNEGAWKKSWTDG